MTRGGSGEVGEPWWEVGEGRCPLGGEPWWGRRVVSRRWGGVLPPWSVKVDEPTGMEMSTGEEADLTVAAGREEIWFTDFFIFPIQRWKRNLGSPNFF